MSVKMNHQWSDNILPFFIGKITRVSSLCLSALSPSELKAFNPGSFLFLPLDAGSSRLTAGYSVVSHHHCGRAKVFRSGFRCPMRTIPWRFPRHRMKETCSLLPTGKDISGLANPDGRCRLGVSRWRIFGKRRYSTRFLRTKTRRPLLFFCCCCCCCCCCSCDSKSCL
ncbi:hypothetical protein BO82DRAFT_6252 [Aspergillus uvarum CBS 121591]|uniref:Uncharacterized protein n=1 Tax=Aspergillus uvarum CBS 121591 TaxID=1448315 RepID=A0A319CPE7_9EURO|nr:hypothetical protein BO82DRAFT_6252 [Aspergillus uvarum CBS 121591]PYH87265.1 hypothetical protein BO82DRAFT_6252 [Aspergillus uvarum CBS 121591]